MSIDWVRQYCLSLPHTTENVQWGNDLVFKIGGKMYAVANLEPGKYCLSFKCAPDTFAELIEREGIAPAPYLARAHWVALENESLRPPELKQLLREAYDQALSGLAKKARAELI